MTMMSSADFINDESEVIRDIKIIQIDFLHTLTIIELDYGVILETVVVDDEDVTLMETLFSRDRQIFTLIGRWRFGVNVMRSYPRDSYLPLRCKVRI